VLTPIQYYHAPVWVCSAIWSQHSPESSFLSCISCLQQLHVKRVLTGSRNEKLKKKNNNNVVVLIFILLSVSVTANECNPVTMRSCWFRWLSDCWPGYIWHDAVRSAAGGHVVCWPSGQHGLSAAHCWQPGHATFPAKLSHHDPPAFRTCCGKLS